MIYFICLLCFVFVILMIKMKCHKVKYSVCWIPHFYDINFLKWFIYETISVKKDNLMVGYIAACILGYGLGWSVGWLASWVHWSWLLRAVFWRLRKWLSRRMYATMPWGTTRWLCWRLLAWLYGCLRYGFRRL